LGLAGASDIHLCRQDGRLHVHQKPVDDNRCSCGEGVFQNRLRQRGHTFGSTLSQRCFRQV
jgi:hypothetical protein